MLGIKTYFLVVPVAGLAALFYLPRPAAIS